MTAEELKQLVTALGKSDSAIKVRDLVVRNVGQATPAQVYRVDSIDPPESGGQVHCLDPCGGQAPEPSSESEWRLYPEDHPRAWTIRTLMSVIGLALALFSFVGALICPLPTTTSGTGPIAPAHGWHLMLTFNAPPDPGASVPPARISYVVLAINAILWTFGPPIWFIVEYTWLAKRYGNPRNKADLQYGQGLASKFWLGIAALLVIIYKGTM